MKNLIFGSALLALLLTGCTSQKMTKPSGQWVAINPDGYVPPNTPVYTKQSTTGDGAVINSSQPTVIPAKDR